MMLTGASETLFIPLAGKARVARYGDILEDEMARKIMAEVDYPFPRSRHQCYLDLYMGIRAAILDQGARDFLARCPGGAVLHLGCGLDARVLRVGGARHWVDVDLPEVMEIRRQFYQEKPGYRMLSADVRDPRWLDQASLPPETPVLVVAEGLTMYLTEEENLALLRALSQRFPNMEYLFDAYSCSAVAWSKRTNPVNKMGAVIRWGLDDPHRIEQAVPGARHLSTQSFTGGEWQARIFSRWIRFWFRTLYGNRWANSLYRIYHFQIGSTP